MTICSTCRHWRGDDTAYRAACGLDGNALGATAFDDSCPQWAARAAPTAKQGSGGAAAQQAVCWAGAGVLPPDYTALIDTALKTLADSARVRLELFPLAAAAPVRAGEYVAITTDGRLIPCPAAGASVAMAVRDATPAPDGDGWVVKVLL